MTNKNDLQDATSINKRPSSQELDTVSSSTKRMRSTSIASHNDLPPPSVTSTTMYSRDLREFLRAEITAQMKNSNDHDALARWTQLIYNKGHTYSDLDTIQISKFAIEFVDHWHDRIYNLVCTCLLMIRLQNTLMPFLHTERNQGVRSEETRLRFAQSPSELVFGSAQDLGRS